MRRTLGPACSTGIERSSTGPVDVLRYDRGTAGLQRAEVRLSGTAFVSHRHAEYALGITTGGVQTFRYRGSRRICLPGQLHLLHPDEPRDIDDPMDDLTASAAVTAISDGLLRLAPRSAPIRPATIDLRAVRLTADHLTHHPATTAPALEKLAGLDRYTLTRHFKAAYGTTRDRYRLLRQLDRARAAIRHGCPLAAAAVDAGFADQSHLTRHFTRTYGLTPGRWRALTLT
jgi:AraC-like DNA-binding protein